MSTHYNIITKSKINDIENVNGIGIHIAEEGNPWINDKYGNGLSIMAQDDGEIIRVTRYGANNPTFILYKLATELDVIFIDEYSASAGMVIVKEPDPESKVGIGFIPDDEDMMKSYTKRFLKWANELDFDKYFAEKKKE